jgi:hypothetical protein
MSGQKIIQGAREAVRLEVVAQMEAFLDGLTAPTIVLSAERDRPFRSISIPREALVDLVQHLVSEQTVHRRAHNGR